MLVRARGDALTADVGFSTRDSARNERIATVINRSALPARLIADGRLRAFFIIAHVRAALGADPRVIDEGVVLDAAAPLNAEAAVGVPHRSVGGLAARRGLAAGGGAQLTHLGFGVGDEGGVGLVAKPVGPSRIITRGTRGRRGVARRAVVISPFRVEARSGRPTMV